MKNITWLDNGLWEYYTQELDRILCGTVQSDEHQELVTIYSHYLHEEKIIPIQLQEYMIHIRTTLCLKKKKILILI